MGWTTLHVAEKVLGAMAEYRNEVGRRLAQLREAAGLDQEELAHAADVSVKTISRLENGHNDPQRATVRKLADALDVNEHDILGEPPSPLGLDTFSQLDRIEAKLDQLLSAIQLEAAPARRPAKPRGPQLPPRAPAPSEEAPSEPQTGRAAARSQHGT